MADHTLRPTRRALLAAGLALPLGAVMAHATPPTLSDADVAAVQAALTQLLAQAEARGLTADPTPAPLMEAVPAFAAAHGVQAPLPSQTPRVLAAYEVLRRGIVNDRGLMSPGADTLAWQGILQITDIPLIARHRDGFEPVWRFFPH